MKKVLFVITKSNWGGAQRYVYDLAVHLPKDNFEVTVATGGRGALVEKLETAGVRTIEIPFLERDVNIVKELKATGALWNVFEKERPDIIHLNSSKIGGLGGLILFVLRYWLWITKKEVYRPTVVFTVHGWAFNEDRPRVARSLIRLIQWSTTWFCQWVIIISNRDFRQAIHLPMVNRKKFVLIPLGIPPESPIFLPKVSARAKLSEHLGSKVGARDLVIGTIAELTKNKGLEYLVEAFAKLKISSPEPNKENTPPLNPPLAKGGQWGGSDNLRLIIIGEGEDRKKLEAQIARENLQNSVSLAGFIANAAECVKAFDVFVLPSLKEGLPYTIIEAMHAGVPIIATHVGGIPDLIENNANGIIVQSKNSEALAVALQKLVEDKKLREGFAHESLKKVAAKFSFDAMLRHTIALYEQPRS